MRALALAVLLILALPLGAAHLAHERPHIQSVNEPARTVQPTIDGPRGGYDLELTRDPFQDLVRHTFDARTGTLHAEYRPQPSAVAEAFWTNWSMGRILEYRDINSNGLFEPKVDTVIHAWPFSGYTWNATGPRAVTIAGVAAQDLAWNGTAANGPAVQVEIDAAGATFTDEGARVLAQDIIVYLDLKGFPPRGVGDLFAIEGSVSSVAGASIDPDRVDENTTAGLVARVPQRLAGFDWGAQATLDRVEQNITVTFEAPAGTDAARALRFHFPLFDHTLHMVFVSAIEYTQPAKRGADGVAPVVLVGAAIIIAFARRRSSGRALTPAR